MPTGGDRGPCRDLGIGGAREAAPEPAGDGRVELREGGVRSHRRIIRRRQRFALNAGMKVEANLAVHRSRVKFLRLNG